MHIAIHYSCYYDMASMLYIHTINYNFNGKFRSVILHESVCGAYDNMKIENIVFEDMKKLVKIYRH